MNLRIQQPTNPPGDNVTNLIVSALSPLDITFARLVVSDVKFGLGSGSGASTFNASTGGGSTRKTTPHICLLRPTLQPFLFRSRHRWFFSVQGFWALGWRVGGKRTSAKNTRAAGRENLAKFATRRWAKVGDGAWHFPPGLR